MQVKGHGFITLKSQCGISSKGTKTTKRLIDTGGFPKKDRTRRIGITSLANIDDEVKRRLRKAYDTDAESRKGKSSRQSDGLSILF